MIIEGYEIFYRVIITIDMSNKNFMYCTSIIKLNLITIYTCIYQIGFSFSVIHHLFREEWKTNKEIYKIVITAKIIKVIYIAQKYLLLLKNAVLPNLL